ncbi:O-acetyltransferase WecH [uncultured archaeon]|nr:O-acetyltransferase WecH [uncultured archaeon]
MSVLIAAAPLLFLLLLIYALWGVKAPDMPPTQKAPLKRIPELDYIRGIAILAVILIHFPSGLTPWLGQCVFSGCSLECDAYLTERLEQWAVPFFFICSGIALMLQQRTGKYSSFGRYFMPKIKRVFLPYVFFCALVFASTPNKFNLASDGLIKTFKAFLLDTAQGNLLVYYFIPLLFTAYIAFPFFAKAFDRTPKLMVPLLLTLFLLSRLDLSSQMFPPSVILTLTMFFLVFGMLISSRLATPNTKRSTTTINTLTILFFPLFGVYGICFDRWYLITYSALVFLATLHFLQKHGKLIPAPILKSLSFLGENSLGIYLSHVIFLNYLRDAHYITSLTSATIIYAVILALSAATGYLVNKIVKEIM